MYRIVPILFLAVLCGCGGASSQLSDPYPGSGGRFLGTPSQAAIDSGKINFTTARFSSFKIGVTTKAEVVDALGKPAGWHTKPDGSSMLEYDYIGASEPPGMRRIMYTMFFFNPDKILVRYTYPGYDSNKAK